MLERLLKDSDEQKTRTRPPLPVSEEEGTRQKREVKSERVSAPSEEVYTPQRPDTDAFDGLDRSRLLPEASSQPEARSVSPEGPRQQTAEEALAALRELAEEAKRQKGGPEVSKKQPPPSEISGSETVEPGLHSRQTPSTTPQDRGFDELRELVGKAERESTLQRESSEEDAEPPEIDSLTASSALDRLLEQSQPKKGPRRGDPSPEIGEARAAESEVTTGATESSDRSVDEHSIFQRLMEKSAESEGGREPLPSLEEIQGPIEALEEFEGSALADEAERLATADLQPSRLEAAGTAEPPVDSPVEQPGAEKTETPAQEQPVSQGSGDKVVSFPDSAKTRRKKQQKEKAGSEAPVGEVPGPDAEPAAAVSEEKPAVDDLAAISEMIDGIPVEALVELFPMEPGGAASAPAAPMQEFGELVAVAGSDPTPEKKPDELIETAASLRYPGVLLPVSLDSDAAAELAALDSLPGLSQSPAHRVASPTDIDFETSCRQPGFLLLNCAVEGHDAPISGPLDLLLAGLPDATADSLEGSYSWSGRGVSRFQLETALPAGMMMAGERPLPDEPSLIMKDLIGPGIPAGYLADDSSSQAARRGRGSDDCKLPLEIQSPRGLLAATGDLGTSDGPDPLQWDLVTSEILGPEAGEFDPPGPRLRGLPAWLIEASLNDGEGFEAKAGALTKPTMPHVLLAFSSQMGSPGGSDLMAREVLGPSGSQPGTTKFVPAEGLGKSRDIYEPVFEMKRPLERDLSDFV